MLTNIRNYINSLSNPITFFVGDFNFIHKDDRRYDPNNGEEFEEVQDIATHYEQTFINFTELFQPNFTRSPARNPLAGRFSRIDRIYTNIPTPQLTDLHISTDTIGDVYTPNRPSDHIPVYTKITIQQRRNPNSIPHHIAAHPAFADNLKKYRFDIDSNDFSEGNLQCVKEIFKEAAKETRTSLLSATTTTPKFLISEAFQLIRAKRLTMHDKTALIYRRTPQMRKYIDSVGFHIIHPNLLMNDLQKTIHDTLHEELEQIEASKIPTERKKQARNRIRRKLFPWRRTRKKVINITITDERDRVLLTIDQQHQILKN